MVDLRCSPFGNHGVLPHPMTSYCHAVDLIKIKMFGRTMFLRRFVVIVLILATFKLDYESKIEYDCAFSIRDGTLRLSCVTPILFLRAQSVLINNMKER